MGYRGTDNNEQIIVLALSTSSNDLVGDNNYLPIKLYDSSGNVINATNPLSVTSGSISLLDANGSPIGPSNPLHVTGTVAVSSINVGTVDQGESGSVPWKITGSVKLDKSNKYVGRVALTDSSGSNNVNVILDNADNVYRLATDSNVHIVGGITSLTGSVKWDKSTTSQQVSTSQYSTFYEKSEKGALFGIIFKVNEDKMNFKLLIDDEEVLNIHLKDELKDMFSLDENDSNVAETPPYIFKYAKDRFKFSPPEPMIFNNSLKLQLKSDKSDKDIEGYIVTWKGVQ